MSSLPLTNPSISLALVEQAVAQHYGLQAQAYALAGEADCNVLLVSESGQKYTAKISPIDVDPQELDFQVSILQHLGAQSLSFQIPTILPSQNGQMRVAMQDEAGHGRWLRVQSWVEGRMLSEAQPRSPELLHQWGSCAGELQRALQDFDHPVAHRFYVWDPSQTLSSRTHLPDMEQGEQRETATYFWDLFTAETQPKLAALRQGVNYNDAHEHNLLINQDLRNPRISGVIDFGDALYTHSINELAIACAYAGMDQPDPLRAMSQVVAGFHAVCPLTEGEIEVLYSLVSARLLITVAQAARNKKREPKNAYLTISERPAWNLLYRWKEIAPALAHYTFRQACGWEACPLRTVFDNWLVREKPVFAPLVQLDEQVLTPLDLSVGSLDLGNNLNFLDITSFSDQITRLLNEQNADIGVGGYGEVRPFYTTDAYQVMGQDGAQWRTVHLGLDIWAQAQTPVYAPLSGEVHSLVNNAGERDYGPTLILRHTMAEDVHFYTLYGHLSLTSLTHLQKGAHVQQGQCIGWIGPAPENGNWPPHLHFQIILNLLEQEGDFPGVAYPAERDVWLSICPDPHLFFPDLPSARTVPTLSPEDILAQRQQRLGRSLSVSYQAPLHIVRGFGAYLYDHTGRRYLDTVNNVAHVGHEHPKVVRAAQRQLAVLNTNTRYLHENVVRFAEELLATFPPALSVVHFVNSGSEANELALRMAQTYTGQKDMLAIEHGYHGNTGGCIAVSSYKFAGKGGGGIPTHTQLMPLPDLFRGKYAGQADAAQQFAVHARVAIERVEAQGRKLAGFIGESILSCGGQIVLPQGYLAEVYQQVREAGGLCIADEVQVGLGRVGETFWAFQLQDVVPDIVTIGKPLGNGHPLAAVVCTEQVAAAFANGMEYFNTFGGNPVSCAIGRSVLQVMEDEQLQEKARRVGAYLTSGLQELQKSYPIIGDVRGQGLFLGFELVKENLVPAAAEATYLANRMRTRGILMSTDGPDHNVLKIKPPLCFSKTNTNFLLENLALVLREDFMRG